jgi:hypothetical protein
MNGMPAPVRFRIRWPGRRWQIRFGAISRRFSPMELKKMWTSDPMLC